MLIRTVGRMRKHVQSEPNCDATAVIWRHLTALTTEDWKPLGLTFVEYPNGELFGKLLALLALTPVFICISFGTLILFRRDMQTIFFFGGQLANEALNYTLKSVIGHLRPCTGRTLFGVPYGMPSSHCQFIWFFTTYLLLFLYIRLPASRKALTNISSFLSDFGWKLAVSVVALAIALLVSYGRGYLQNHSTNQILVGSALGISLGALWFIAVNVYFAPHFYQIALWPICEFLLIRDTTLVPNIILFDYLREREEVRNRKRKVSTR